MARRTRLVIAPALLAAQGKGLDPADIRKPLADEWTDYNGDYSGKPLQRADPDQHPDGEEPDAGLGRQADRRLGQHDRRRRRPRRRRPGGAAGLIVGGEGTGEYPVSTDVTIKASVLSVDGTLYVTAPDNGWALDARDGRELWHYFWKTRGGTHIATRGFGMWNDYLYMETPDNYLVSLEAKTGKERWHKVISDFNQQYFSTMAPVVIGNHVLVGTGNDLDAPGFLQSFDPETGELQWKLYTVPMNPGDPGLDTWPSLDAARHGGAQAWLRRRLRSRDEALYLRHRQPDARLHQRPRRGRQPLHRLADRRQRRHRQDGVALPDRAARHARLGLGADAGPGRRARSTAGMRKLVMTAARNGYFFVLDRVTGEHLLTSKYGSATNWVKAIDEKGRPMRKPEKDASIGGALVSPSAGGTINWEPPAFNPGHRPVLRLARTTLYSIFYLTDPDPRGSMGLGGHEESRVGTGGSFLTALDYRTGKARWRHKYRGGAGGGGGMLTTAGGLVFAGDGGGNIVAHDAATGTPLWHSRIGDVTNPPQTYLIDGRQHLLVAAGDTLYAFVMY